MNPEHHLFVVWNKARKHEKEILHDLQKRFHILQISDISWTRKFFFRNLCRFYGERHHVMRYKEFHCGVGPFLLIVVRDDNPIYMKRKTLKGDLTVNTRIFDAKCEYRELSGGGHRVHGTNSIREFDRDYHLLTGGDPSEVSGLPDWDGKVTRLERDLPGVTGWKSFRSFFQTMNACESYVVLRNYESLANGKFIDGHKDVDILCEHLQRFSLTANASRWNKYAKRVLYTVKINGKPVSFDFRHLGDGYYDEKWERDLLNNRELHVTGGFYVPKGRARDYSILYHALVHKRQLGIDYRDHLVRIFGHLLQTDVEVEAALFAELTSHMNQNGYEFTVPKDQTVFFNPKYTMKKGDGFYRNVVFPAYRLLIGRTQYKW